VCELIQLKYIEIAFKMGSRVSDKDHNIFLSISPGPGSEAGGIHARQQQGGQDCARRGGEASRVPQT